MKKLLLTFTLIGALLVGCTKIMNTPTKKVEELMSKYQKVDDDIKNEINALLNDEVNLTEEERKEYYDIITNQYKKLTYVIKDETVDKDKAVVTTEIEVIDYKKEIDNVDSRYSSDATLDKNNYNKDKISALKNAKEKVKYTLEINVTKDKDGNWSVDSLTSNDRKKIQGMY